MNQDYIKKLIRILEHSKIDSIQLSSFWGMNKIKLFKSSHKVATLNSAKNAESTTNHSEDTPINQPDNINNNYNKEMAAPIKEEAPEGLKSSELSLHEIKAPLVGTFYLSPKPGEPSFVQLGDKIKPGQTLCIIEAMKIFNDIDSEISGTIKEILIEDSQPVEYGQAIMLVETDD